MARIRSVKPDLFTSVQVGRVSHSARFFWIGLFTQADKVGRLEWEPQKLRALIFPYDTPAVDVEALASELAAAGLVRFYLAGDAWILEIPKFAKHQRPHPKEADSGLPALPTDAEYALPPWSTTASREKPGSIPSSPGGREGDLGRSLGSGSDGRTVTVEVGPPAHHRGPKRHGASLLSGIAAGTAAVAALDDTGRVLEIPESWAKKARNDYALTHADIDAFAAALGSKLRAAGGVVEDTDPATGQPNRWKWLDRELAAWRSDRHVADVNARNEALWRRQDAEERARVAALPKRTPEQVRALLDQGRDQALAEMAAERAKAHG